MDAIQTLIPGAPVTIPPDARRALLFHHSDAIDAVAGMLAGVYTVYLAELHKGCGRGYALKFVARDRRLTRALVKALEKEASDLSHMA